LIGIDANRHALILDDNAMTRQTPKENGASMARRAVLHATARFLESRFISRQVIGGGR
jgi:hypothetical protein